MERQKVYVGSIVALSSGQVQDDRREVEFEAEKLAQVTEYGFSDRTGGPTDTRGVTWTLYRLPDGRYIVHTEEWSRWQGEPNRYKLCEASEADLAPGGRYEKLGYEAGMGRPLTLEEALGR